jgi:hypothetical protein
MHALSVIKSACLSALDPDDEDAAGRLAEFRSIADPRTVLELVEKVETQEGTISEEELQALGKLVRDLTGYIKLHGGIKPDPIRDDLLLQARQLLGVTGI